MSAVLLFLSAWRWWLIGGAALALAVVIGAQRVSIAHLETAVAQWKAKWSDEKAGRATDRSNAAESALLTAKQYREKEQGWVRQHQETENVAQKKVDAADAAVARANDVARSLSGRVAALTAAARRPTAGASAPAACEAAADAADLLGRMLERVDQAAGVVASYADRLRISGEACVAAYETVSATPKGMP